jgi:hypothetical protein
MARKNTYACTSCKKTFSRKFNAERHNKIVHEEMAMVYNKETDWKSNIKKSSLKSSTIIDHTIKSTSSSPSSLKPDKDIDNLNPKQTYNNNLKDLYKDDLYLDNSENKDDQLVFKIIGKMAPYIDTLDSLLLSKYPDNNDRIKILSSILITSLTTSNPIKFIKEQINFLHSLIAMKKSMYLISHYYNIKPKQARETLKGLVLSAPYSKNKFQQNPGI